MIARLLSWFRSPALPPPTLDEARTAFLSACARGDADAQAEAWKQLHDAFARTAGRGCA